MISPSDEVKKIGHIVPIRTTQTNATCIGPYVWFSFYSGKLQKKRADPSGGAV